MRIVCYENWNGGIWHVRAEWYGVDVAVFEPRNGDSMLDLFDCILYVKENS